MKKLEKIVDRFGLIGRDIDYSFSRGYFKNKFEQENISATYENFDIPDIASLELLLNNEVVKGYNVTIPYKESIIPLLDRLDPAAAAIGAVNTVRREIDGSLAGYNTDYIGFRDTLLEHFKLTILRQEYDENLGKMRLEYPHKALILGTGGASKGVLYALRRLGIGSTFISRKRDKNATPEVLAYEDLTERLMDTQTFIINCTPLGTYPATHQKPNIPYEYLHDTQVAFDLIYNPPQTTFLKLANTQGATTINGHRMLELQAEASWEIWNTAQDR